MINKTKETMSALEEWNSPDAKPPYYIRWYHYLFLWLIPTRKAYDDEGVLYFKRFRGHFYIMGWKRLRRNCE